MTTHDWDPKRYLTFGNERLRPALDLIARIDHDHIKTVYDLGCGAGNVTQILAQRWPDAQVTGIDSSAAMLGQARQNGAAENLGWQKADLAHWVADEPADLVFSNAALHWLSDHDRLFVRLLDMLKLDGVLAVQMPNNFAAPSHTAIARVVRDGPWRDLLVDLLKPTRVDPLAIYFDRLAPHCRDLDLWETTYTHILNDDRSGLHPVTQWTRTTALRPFLGGLDNDGQQAAFLAAHSGAMDDAYPRRSDGRVLFAFTRLFMVARL